MQETPTTQSIRNLSAFHINTPQNTRSHIETTPKKGNHFANYYGSRSGSKRNRSQNFRWSTDKSIFDSIDENSENTFNDDISNTCNQSINVSPIKPHNNSGFNPNQIIHQLDGKYQSLQRHPSGIESSTPKMTIKRTHTQSIVKTKMHLTDEMTNRIIRKTQSFSPAKRSALREIYQPSLEPDDIPFEADELQTCNPARKVLEFNAEQFNQLTQMSRPSNFQTPTKINKHVINDEVVNVPSPTNQFKLKRLSAQKQSRLINEFSRKKTMKPMLQTPKKSLGSLNESDILASLAPDNETDTCQTMSSVAIQATDDSLMDISDLETSTLHTPSSNTVQKSHVILSDTPIRDDCVEQHIRKTANRTPTKRFEKSISHSFLAVKSSPEKDRFELLYGGLPCTPPKNRIRMKRPAPVNSPLPSEPAAKRKLYEMIGNRPLMTGIEKMDVLTQLKKLGLDQIISNIFRDLSDASLQAASSVCKSWKCLIDGNHKLRSRRRQFIEMKQMTKENLRSHNHKSNVIENNNTKPLHIHNKNYQVEEKPVVISPSTRRFNEHQKVYLELLTRTHDTI